MSAEPGSARDRRLRLAAAALAACFVALAGWVALVGSPPGDERVLVELYDVLGTSWDDAMVAIGVVTNTGPLVAYSVAVVVALVVASRRADAVRFGAVVAVVFLVNPVLKLLIDRPRPTVRPSPEDLSVLSFPSGHAAGSAVVAGALVLLVRSRRWRPWAALAGAAAVAVVGFSRVAIGVHYPSDVVGAWLWVAAWLLLVQSTAMRLPSRAAPDRPAPP
jgi:undecaprenyl-diphosphatase